MMATIYSEVKEYYRQITEIDIGAVARDILGDRIVRESPALLECDCPNHQSQSRRSLHITPSKQRWYCFGCGVGGDVLQLVEFVQSGCVTKGQTGPMPDSHRLARDYLAAKVGLSSLPQYGLSPEQLERAEKARNLEISTQNVLTLLVDYYHQRLRCNHDALGWLKSQYGFGDEIIDTLKIGFADNRPGKDAEGNDVPGIIETLMGEPYRLTKQDLVATGAFCLSKKEGKLYPFFDRRIIFPYWSRGRVVFMIGRRMPFTPVSQYELAKYKKILVHNEVARPYVAPCINNSYLYNEDCLLPQPKRLVITEGVTDCISLMEHCFPTISPATVRFRNDDIQHLVPKLRNVGTVYICQDNELSQVGLEGALQTAGIFAKHNIETRVVVLPLGENHRQARQALKVRFNLDIANKPKSRKELLKKLSTEEVDEIEKLIASAKIDVNEYFLSGKTSADFEALLKEAQTPIELSISSLPKDLTEKERNSRLEPVFAGIAGQPPLEQDRLLKTIQSHFGKKEFSLSTLRQQVRLAHKEAKQQQKSSRPPPTKPTAPPGSCRAAIETVAIAAKEAGQSPDIIEMAEAAFHWFIKQGARFFYTPDAEPFMFFRDHIYWLDSHDRGRKRWYRSMLMKEAGIVPTTKFGNHFIEIMSSLTLNRGKERPQFTWLHSDVSNFTIYFNLNNQEKEIAKISPEGVEIIKNGGNEDGIILGGANKVRPIHYIKNADPNEAMKYIDDLIINNLSCSPLDRLIIWAWICCIPLYDFAGTRPMTRFEGPSQSGKSTAAKLLTTLLYGEQQQKISTIAANYTDGARNPLVSLDNIETAQMTDELLSFMLTSITGIAKEKRKAGTDTENVSESTTCFINSTGIEPLGGEYSEVLSRSLVIRFDQRWKSEDVFLEAHILSDIKKHRDLILSTMFDRLSQVLAMARDGLQTRAVKLIQTTLGHHYKERCNEYLSLMYLTMMAGKDQAELEKELTTMNAQFNETIGALNEVSAEAARESNPIATALAALFRAYRQAKEIDEEGGSLYEHNSRKAAFIERYQLKFEDTCTIRNALARELFIALKRLTKDFSLNFRINSVQQFIQRFCNDLEIIRESGFEIRFHYHRANVRTYDILLKGDNLLPDEWPEKFCYNQTFLNDY